MAETKKKDIVFNIKQIDTFRKGREEIMNLLDTKKRDVKQNLTNLTNKRAKLLVIKESVELDRKRQYEEKAKQAELIAKEKATPLFEDKVKEPVKKEESEQKLAPEIIKASEQIKETEKVVEKPSADSIKEPKREKSTDPTKEFVKEKMEFSSKKPIESKDKEKVKDSKVSKEEKETKREVVEEKPKVFEHSVFANNKKPKIEIPKVRVFVPAPPEPKRTYNRDPNGQPRENNFRRDFNKDGTRPPFNRDGARPPYNRDGARPPYNKDGTRPPFNKDGTRPPFNRDGARPPLQRAPKIFTPPPFANNLGKDKKKLDDKKRQSQQDEKRDLTKKDLIKRGYSAIQYNEDGEIKKIRSRKASDKRKDFNPQLINITNAIINTDALTIKSLAEKIGKPGTEIIKKLLLLNIFKSINDVIDFDTAYLVASELGIELELKVEKTKEEKLIESFITTIEDDPKDLKERPPIVTVMGHVDHGKTSILDSIRKANVVSGEAGGITQHIGAYSVTLNGKAITFLDTPGHEAFTSMRARGANVTDIVVIVVAADDGIMPQTIEAINHAKSANVSIIVAVNKMDKPTADPDKVLSQLTEHGITPEDWGGDTPVVKVSAKAGTGISELLENILTAAEVLELKANPNRRANGTIIEARLDKGKGSVATVLVQNGTLSVSDFAVVGNTMGRIRAMFDDKGKTVKKAGPSMAVSILGLQEVPNAGDQIMVVEDEKTARDVISERLSKDKENLIVSNKVSLDDVFGRIAEGKLKDLNLIIKADVQGSAEALRQSLLKLTNDEVKVVIVHCGVGAINESDVVLADATNSIIIGFNVKPDPNARNVADKNKIDIRNYKIIYDAIDDIEKAINGMLTPKYKEEFVGRAEIRQIFKLSSVGLIAGCMVKDGKIVRNSKVRVLRNDKEIYEGMLGSLKRMKDDVKEVATGYECGLSIEGFNEIKEGDIVEAFQMVRI